jgi:3D (Asp-Asp-Asp) domain-containing protein
LGKTFEIEGIGIVKCEDTGGAIKGQGRFDLYVENVSEAYAYGTQYLEYWEVNN